jgi:hypothetical protein
VKEEEGCFEEIRPHRGEVFADMSRLMIETDHFIHASEPMPKEHGTMKIDPEKRSCE